MLVLGGRLQFNALLFNLELVWFQGAYLDLFIVFIIFLALLIRMVRSITFTIVITERLLFPWRVNLLIGIKVDVVLLKFSYCWLPMEGSPLETFDAQIPKDTLVAL